MTWLGWIQLAIVVWAYAVLWRAHLQRKAAIRLLDESKRLNKAGLHFIHGMTGVGPCLVVPREPTPDMLRAAEWWGFDADDAEAVWENMIVAWEQDLPIPHADPNAPDPPPGISYKRA